MSLKIKLFTMRFNPSLGEFDDTAITRFLADKDLIEARDHFYIHQGMPYVTLVLLYNSLFDGGNKSEDKNSGKQSERFNPREVLAEEDWSLYTSLKEWRNELAKAEGIPPYIIATNRQIAEIAKSRPDTLEKLKRIEGLGEGKIESYGRAILEFISEADKPLVKEQTKAANSNDNPQQS